MNSSVGLVDPARIRAKIACRHPIALEIFGEVRSSFSMKAASRSLQFSVVISSFISWTNADVGGGQDQKIRQANPMSNTKDENEPNDAEAVTLSRFVPSRFISSHACPLGILWTPASLSAELGFSSNHNRNPNIERLLATSTSRRRNHCKVHLKSTPRNGIPLGINACQLPGEFSLIYPVIRQVRQLIRLENKLFIFVLELSSSLIAILNRNSNG